MRGGCGTANFRRPPSSSLIKGGTILTNSSHSLILFVLTMSCHHLVKKFQFALGHPLKCETDPTGVYRQEDATETATAINNVENDLVKRPRFTMEVHYVKCETDPTGVYRQEDTLMEPLQYVSATAQQSVCCVVITGHSIKNFHPITK